MQQFRRPAVRPTPAQRYRHSGGFRLLEALRRHYSFFTFSAPATFARQASLYL